MFDEKWIKVLQGVLKLLSDIGPVVPKAFLCDAMHALSEWAFSQHGAVVQQHRQQKQKAWIAFLDDSYSKGAGVVHWLTKN